MCVIANKVIQKCVKRDGVATLKDYTQLEN